MYIYLQDLAIKGHRLKDKDQREGKIKANKPRPQEECNLATVAKHWLL